MRRMKSLLVAASLFAALGAVEASAQTSPRGRASAAAQANAEAAALQDISNSGMVSAGNMSTLGGTNSARIYARVANRQSAAQPNARGNTAFVRQVGAGNEGYITQNNTNNAAFMVQVGNNHYADLTQYGGDRTLVLQTPGRTLVRALPPRQN